MKSFSLRSLRIVVAAAAGLGCLFVGDSGSALRSGQFISVANAIIGRPLTPMSYAGVARRTTARAMTYGAVAGAAAVAVAPACAQTVDVYGRIVTVCR